MALEASAGKSMTSKSASSKGRANRERRFTIATGCTEIQVDESWFDILLTPYLTQTIYRAAYFEERTMLDRTHTWA
jgi:hypothetical protein